MNNLPIPKSRSGWVAALINTIILFFVYYWLFFAGILDIYRDQLETVDFEKGTTIPLKITIKSPKFYDPSGTTWVFLYAENQSKDPLSDVEVYLIISSSKPAILLPNLYDNDVYNLGVKFSIIEPQSIATGRIRFIAQTDPQFNGLLLKASGKTEELKPKSTNRMNESRFKAFQQGLLETLLLPPWSNGLIFALALFSSYVVKKDFEEEPELFAREFWRLVFDNWKKSALVLAIIVTLIAPMVYELMLPPLFIVLEVVLIWVEKPYKKKDDPLFMTIGIVLAIVGVMVFVTNLDMLLWVKTLWGLLVLGNLILVVGLFAGSRKRTNFTPSPSQPNSTQPTTSPSGSTMFECRGCGFVQSENAEKCPKCGSDDVVPKNT